MKKITVSSIFIGSVLLTACASQGGWEPTVDSYNDPNANRINQDMVECKQLASKASGGTATETAVGLAQAPYWVPQEAPLLEHLLEAQEQVQQLEQPPVEWVVVLIKALVQKISIKALITTA